MNRTYHDMRGNPVSDGDTVWWRTDNTGWRTGRLIGRVDRGRHAGDFEVEPTGHEPRPRVFLDPLQVESGDPKRPSLLRDREEA